MKLMGMSGFATLVLWVSAALFGPVPAGQQIPSGAKVTVHLINARSGRPLVHKTLRMLLVGHDKLLSGHLDAKTNCDGVAIFHLSGPLPEFVVVQATTGVWWNCGSADEPGIRLTEILTSGVSKEDLCLRGLRAIDGAFRPKPGELYTFWVRPSILERWKYCGHWGCREYPPIRGSSTPAEARAPAAGTPDGGKSLAYRPSRYKIVIRVVNGKNGRPVARKPLVVFTLLAQPDPGTGLSYRQTRLETDDSGQAIFGLNDPQLKLYVLLALKGVRLCSAERVSPAKVLREGLVEANKCNPTGKIRAKFVAKPGEVVVFQHLPRF